MDHLDKENLKKFKSKRRKVHCKMEEERDELLNQLESLIKNWKGPLTDLRPFLRREEIDELLIRIVKNRFHFAKTYAHVIESVIKTGYRDEPEVNKNGKPLLRRTTAVHWLNGQNKKEFFIGMLFKIYNRFDVNYVSKWGSTHFHVACQCGRDDVVRKFLELGQDANCLAQDRVDPPLHSALKRKHKKVVELLLRSGADANLMNKDGLTPLHIICKSVGYYDNKLAELFFEINGELHQPVEVNVRDKWGRTPLQLAVANLMPDAVDTLLVNGADPTDFIFPSDLAKRYPLDCEIQIIVFRTTSIVESLESRGYKLDRTAALTIMKVFATYGLIDDSVNVDKCLLKDNKFARIAKRQLLTSRLTLYDFLRLPPEEAEKLFTIDDYKEFTSGIWHLCDESHKAYNLYLCETITRGFFRRWALKLFSEKNPWLPQSCYKKIIGQLKIKDLWSICMTTANEDTRWLDSVRINYIKRHYNRKISLSYPIYSIY
uniref:Uncharacterized protein n=1 Tax=Trichogramma kaykai TaxID=54128 RepID=A0ABD2XK64_9HYME